MPSQRRIQIAIRDFNFGRDALPLIFCSGAIAITAIGGIWDGLIPSVGLFILLASNVARRIEWRGRGLPAALSGKSVFRYGIRALPDDVVTLTIAVIAIPAGNIATVILFGTVWAWAGLAFGIPIALFALIRLAFIALRQLNG